MWVQLTSGPESGMELGLPASFWTEESEEQIVLRYGAGVLPVQVQSLEPDTGGGDGSSRLSPASVVVAPAVIQRLAIRTEPVYQLRRTDQGVEIGPVLGLLLGNRNHWYDHEYLHREPERVAHVYRRTGGLFCAFSPRNVSLKHQCAYGLYYNPGSDTWVFGKVPLPAAMHRRSFHADPEAVERLKLGTGAYLFNSRRFDKWELDQILRQDHRFRIHLPDTLKVTAASEVIELAARHKRVILKPADLSRGRGILFVDDLSGVYRLTDCRIQGETRERMVSRDELERTLEAEVVQRNYLCQQRIDLATIGGSPFDIRVVMQRNPRCQWQCTGIECRLAGAGEQVTNIAHGGRALRIDEAVESAFPGDLDPHVVEGVLIGLSERFCRIMDNTGEVFAEFGIDLALDRKGRAWLIEANVLPTFKGFLAIDPEAYRKILTMPLLHASYAVGFGEPAPEGPDPGC